MGNWDAIIHDFRRVSQNPTFLAVRKDAEEMARHLLDRKCGRFTEDDFKRFLDLINTEITPSKTNSYELRSYEVRTRFRPAFMGKNRNSMIKILDECNRWIANLWLSRPDGLDSLDQFWKESSVNGAGTSLPTAIMYLKDPEIYNVWTPMLAKGLGILLEKKFKMAKTCKNYLFFNDEANKVLRKPFNLRPQEIDYILFRIAIRLK